MPMQGRRLSHRRLPSVTLTPPPAARPRAGTRIASAQPAVQVAARHLLARADRSQPGRDAQALADPRHATAGGRPAVLVAAVVFDGDLQDLYENAGRAALVALLGDHVRP